MKGLGIWIYIYIYIHVGRGLKVQGQKYGGGVPKLGDPNNKDHGGVWFILGFRV